MKTKHIAVIILVIIFSAALIGFFNLQRDEELQDIEQGMPTQATVAEDAGN